MKIYFVSIILFLMLSFTQCSDSAVIHPQCNANIEMPINMLAIQSNQPFQPNSSFFNSRGQRMKVSLLYVYLSDFYADDSTAFCTKNLLFNFSRASSASNAVLTSASDSIQDLSFDVTRQKEVEVGDCLESTYDIDLGEVCKISATDEDAIASCFQIAGFYDADNNGTTEKQFSYSIRNNCPNCLKRGAFIGKTFSPRNGIKLKLSLDNLFREFNPASNSNNDTLIMNVLRRSISIQ